jgi:hypothetical protein
VRRQLKRLTSLGASIGLIMTLVSTSLAQFIQTPTATITCSGYTLSAQACELKSGQNYLIDYNIVVSPISGPPSEFSNAVGFTAETTTNGTSSCPNNTFTETVSGSPSPPFPLPPGTYTYSGTAALNSFNATGINFTTSSLTCPSCSTPSTNNSNFNGTAIPAGSFVWFNANFQLSGTVTDGTTISLTGAQIQLSGQGVNDTLSAPNATITFSSSVSCTSTTFNTATNTWETTVPTSSHDDEIFLDGFAFPVPSGGLPGGINNVVWLGNFSSSEPSLNLQWKWGAAVYDTTFPGYDDVEVKAGHQTACGISNGDHAGTPENASIQQALIGGARGGGGSNFTGSWSGTVSVSPCNAN